MSMRLYTTQIIAALLAAVCIVIAFIAAGAALVSGFFMLLAVAALGWIAWSAMRRVLARNRSKSVVRASASGDEGAMRPRP